MTTLEISQKFISQPKYIKNGAGYLSKKWNVTREEIRKARELAKQHLVGELVKKAQSEPFQVMRSDEMNITKPVFVGSTEETQRGIRLFESPFPLSPAQVIDLVKADGINTEIHKVNNKMLPNGYWSYNIEVRYKNSGFYTKESLKDKLKDLFPNVTPISLPVVKREGEKALFILLSDDHVGIVNGESMFGVQPYTGSVYAKRLLEIVNEAKNIGYTFDEVHLISLGDQMNGFNSQTTRGGHEVKSLSNKEQFDIYTTARRIFYDDLFTSGISERYFVHDIENSNHTGNDFSYMANKLLEIYIEYRYPQVSRKSYFKPINSIEYGIHTIGFGHGKDEKLMFKPMPLKLDPKTDLLLFQYFDRLGHSPADRRITMYKGDLHSYAMDKGKFGRYINIPSIMGSNDYSEINFGHTEAGAVLEVFHKNDKMIQHIPLWF